jgi:oxygen-independent coproporphyrinogen-3 oxidase
MCQFETRWHEAKYAAGFYQPIIEKLVGLREDGLIELDTQQLIILPKGKPFVRNVCMAFDLDLMRQQPDKPLFSATI